MQEGEVLNYDERFEAMRPRLLAIGRSLAGNGEAEDIVQETYVRGRAGFEQLRDGHAFDGWLARIAVNACYNHRRGLRKLVTGMLGAQERSDPAPARDLALRDLIERLPRRERVVLVLHYGHGYGLDEVAGILGITHVNARTVAHRARRRLAADWKEMGA